MGVVSDILVFSKIKSIEGLTTLVANYVADNFTPFGTAAGSGAGFVFSGLAVPFFLGG